MSAAVQAEAFFPLDRVPLVTLARAKKGASRWILHTLSGGLRPIQDPSSWSLHDDISGFAVSLESCSL